MHDGDTITALDDGNTQHRIRLQGIDAPELGQPFGRVARDRLVALAKGKTPTIHTTGKDRYGRVLATVEIERDARAAGSGLWGDREPVPPWEWRAGAASMKGLVYSP